jgi:hypothetical protein
VRRRLLDDLDEVQQGPEYLQKMWQSLLDLICSMETGNGLYRLMYAHDINIDEVIETLTRVRDSYNTIHKEK